jgi:hypothetical protein
MVTKEPKPQPDIAGRPRFESLLSDLTARFANLPPARVGGEITTALRQICEGLQLDRSTLWEFPASDPQVAHLRHKYQMMERLDLHTSVELAHFAIKHGLVEI